VRSWVATMDQLGFDRHAMPPSYFCVKQISGRREMGRPHDALILGSQVPREVGDAIRLHPDAAIGDFYMLEDVCFSGICPAGPAIVSVSSGPLAPKI